ncbi:unnamed protein product, partial [Brassica oleracea var. botrytis]
QHSHYGSCYPDVSCYHWLPDDIRFGLFFITFFGSFNVIYTREKLTCVGLTSRATCLS